MTPIIGAIADDFTGAVDLATTLVARGYRTRVYFGLPDPGQHPGGADAVVIGLKTRSAPVADAVAESRAALAILRGLGLSSIYDKYCATFDSTPEGNIGPILDALMSDLGVDRTVVVLPFPEAGRTMYQGHLFVHGIPLDETSMRDHPLTPMTDSRIARLLTPQTNRPVHELRLKEVGQGAASIADRLTELGPGITVIDAIGRRDLDEIASALVNAPLVSGGAGLAASLPHAGQLDDVRVAPLDGGCVVLAGSASQETQRQLAIARAVLPAFKLNLDALRADFDGAIRDIVFWVAENRRAATSPVMIYATGDPADVDRAAADSATLVEKTLAAIARQLVADGVRRIIVAGGETSGSVTQALGVRSFDVSAPLSPGIAWARAQTPDGIDLDLLLKSGSLGTEDIFLTAWAAGAPLGV
ncbi:MAG: four-carbon acid sugar kinase family protein [Microbacteriaceae bacterium]|nr:MAG: four-carbon acid sugar kinase family protein [Microbacteriaceae bacterium]